MPSQEPSSVANVPELGREDDFVAAVANRPPDQPLVRERAVDVGRVEEIDPEIERR